MRILFAGTSEIAIPSLRAIASKFSVVGVLTAPDKATGRGRRLRAPAVKTEAQEIGLTVLQPPLLDAITRASIESLKPDMLVTFAYGKIFGPKFLSLFPLDRINMHPSALPRYRGPSPLTAAILAGDTMTALTVQRIALKMDSGDILRQRPLPISPYETTGSLMEKAARLAADELTTVIEQLGTGSLKGNPQDPSMVTYCHKILKEDGNIDWRCPAVEIERMVRAYQPWPKAQTVFLDQKLFILESQLFPLDSSSEYTDPGTVLDVDKSHGILIKTGDGVLGVTQLQAAAKKSMHFRSFLNGVSIKAGMKWGQEK